LGQVCIPIQALYGALPVLYLLWDKIRPFFAALVRALLSAFSRTCCVPLDCQAQIFALNMHSANVSSPATSRRFQRMRR
jgi:hypothetical protein